MNSREAISDAVLEDPRRQYAPAWKLEILDWQAECIDAVLNGDPNYPQNWRDMERYGRLGSLTCDPDGYLAWLAVQGLTIEKGKIKPATPEPKEWR